MRNAGFLIFNDMELLDIAGPYEVLSVAHQLNGNALFNTFCIEENKNQVKTINGLKIVPDYGFTDTPKIDLLFIPGGHGIRSLLSNTRVHDWVRKAYDLSEMTLSVCSGTLLLGKLGLLDGKKYSTHHDVFDDMKAIAPKAFLSLDRFTDSGKVMTSAGISAGIDMALYLVEKLYKKNASDLTRTYMEYGDWTHRRQI